MMKRLIVALLLATTVPTNTWSWWWQSDDLSPKDIKEMLREVLKQQQALRDRVAYLEGSAGGLMKRIFVIGKKNLSLVSNFVLDYLQYANENKASTCALLCGVGCSYVSLRIVYLHVMLSRQQLWSFWHKEQDIQNLSGEAALVLARDLIKDIQMRYLDVSNVTDVMGPVRQFMIAVDREIEQLREYTKIAKFMEMIQLSFVIDQQLLAGAEKRMHRLERLKTLCVEWLADIKYKLAVGLTNSFQQRLQRVAGTKTAAAAA